jgi:hypothetical protein
MTMMMTTNNDDDDDSSSSSSSSSNNNNNKNNNNESMINSLSTHCQYSLIGQTSFRISKGHKTPMTRYMSKCICATNKYWLCVIN